MKITKLAATLAGATMLAGPAMADLVIPDLSYRTGPYAPGGTPFSDGYQDYFALLNARDGGINGEPIRVIECETGYNTEKGMECYEGTKGEGALLYQPMSTGITYQMIPKTAVDGIPIHTIGYGRTSAVNGTIFRNVFNYPGNYWDAASVIVVHLLDENGGSLEGKKITLLHHNSAYGREPIRTLEELSKKHGFTFKTIAVDHPGQEQKSQWLQIRRERPDYVIMYGWGVMNQVAVQEATNIGYPMDQFIGGWWSGAEHDALPAGPAADGYKALNFHWVDASMPVFDDIREHVFEAGNAAGDGSNIGKTFYTRGVYAAYLAAEAIRKAQEIHGVTDITSQMMRDGMESLAITNEMMAEAGLPRVGPEFTVTCENHGGSGMAVMTQWNASSKTWEVITDYIAPDKDVIDALIAEDSAAYAAENNITPGCN